MKSIKPISVFLILVALRVNCSALEPRINFIDISSGQTAIMDKSCDSYFEKLQSGEIHEKSGYKSDIKTPKDYREFYRSKVLDFTLAEKQVITESIKQIHQVFISSYPLLGLREWNFIKISTEIEGNTPHTIGKNIILASTATLNNFLNELTYALIEEQIHVLQREKPQYFISLYQDWGFKPVSIDTADLYRSHN